MGQPPLKTGEHPHGPVLSVSAGCAGSHPASFLIVRATRADDVRMVAGIDPGRIVWIETPLALAGAAWPAGVGIDVVVADPALESAFLYNLSRLRGDRPLRVTIPVVGGVGRAARIAMALHMPVRLLPQKAPREAVSELYPVLDTYLHDPRATSSVQPFDSALSFWLHGDPATAWMALDLDPAFVHWIPDCGETRSAWTAPGDPGFVAGVVARLVEGGAECATCQFVGWCAGLFKWPDPAYACDAVKPLIGEIAESAARVACDVEDASALRT